METYECIDCNKTNKRTLIRADKVSPNKYQDQNNKITYGNTCHTCNLKKQKEYRKTTGDVSTKSYEKTPKGYLMRTYRNMKSRVTGIQKKKAHLYKNLDLLPKEEFYKWAMSRNDFIELYKEWCINEYKQKLSPSIDRINSKNGYVLENMRWITHSENSRNGNISRFKKTL